MTVIKIVIRREILNSFIFFEIIYFYSPYVSARPFNFSNNVTNKTKVIDVKKAFAKEMGIKYDKYNIRFLFKGQELINEHLLCYNNVENQSKIQVMVSKKES